MGGNHAIRKNEPVIGRIVENRLPLCGLQLVVVFLEGNGVGEIAGLLAVTGSLRFHQELEGAFILAGSAEVGIGLIGEGGLA